MPETVSWDAQNNPYGTPTGTVASSPLAANPADIERMVRVAAGKYGIDPDYAARLAHQESSFSPVAVSTKGAQGVMQLMPKTAEKYGVTDPFNPQQNIDAGLHYYSDLVKQYNGDHVKAAAAYNAGPTAVDDGSAFGFKETKDYLSKVQPPTTPPPNLQGQLGIGWDQGNSPFAPRPGESTVTQPTSPFDWQGFLKAALETPGPAISAAVRENLPAIGAAVGAGMIPGAEEFAPGIAARAPILMRAGVPMMRIAGSLLGAGAGQATQEALEGNIPSIRSIPEILANQGPQAAVQAIFEVPGIIKPAASFAEDTFRKAFKPTTDEMKDGVLDTLQNEKVLPNGNAQLALAARDDQVRQKVMQSLASHANDFVSNKDIIDKFNDFVLGSSADKKAFQGRWLNEASDIVNEWIKDHPNTDMPLTQAEDFKADLRRQANVKFGETGTYKNQLYKQLSKIIDDEIEVQAPELTALHNRWKGIIDARPTVDRYITNRGGREMMSPWVARSAAMGVAGAGMGMYTVHHPWQGAMVGALTGAAISPEVYAPAALLMRNYPELMRQVFAGTGRVVANKGVENVVNLANTPWSNQNQ